MLAIIAAIVTIMGAMPPVITVWLTNRARAQERAEDYARQDERAARVETVAADLAANNDKVAGRIEEQSAAIEHVRVLVNNDKTVLVQEQHDARQAQLVTLRELVALRQRAGEAPSREALDAVRALERRVAELATELDDRARQLALVDTSGTDRTIRS